MDGATLENVSTAVTVATVAGTISLYSLAAFEALHGRVPGPYISLLLLTPLGLMSSYLPLVWSLLRTIVPSVAALVLLVAAAVSATAFQGAVATGNSAVVLTTAVICLCIFSAAAYAQGSLSVEGARGLYQRRLRLADALSAAAADKAADKAAVSR